MTYKQIEKEFDELFVKKVMLIDEPDKLAYEEMKWQVEPERIKSFLKQSFIKYLQSEVERLEKRKEWNRKDKEFVETYINGYEHCLQDQITHLQAQIKELEV